MRTRPRKLNYFAPVPTGDYEEKERVQDGVPVSVPVTPHPGGQPGTDPKAPSLTIWDNIDAPSQKVTQGRRHELPPLHTDSVRLCYCPGSCWSPPLQAPSEFMDTVDSGFCPIWGLLEEDGTPSPRAGKPSIQAFVPVLVPLATSFLPSQPRSGLVRLRGQEITLTGVTTQFLRSLAWPALGWRLATACRL